VVTEKVGMVPGVDEEGGENEVEGDLESMQGVEPDVGLIRWVEEVRELVCPLTFSLSLKRRVAKLMR
jgi:hypothetical protein